MRLNNLLNLKCVTLKHILPKLSLMKKFYYLLLILLSFSLTAQTPIITLVSDGDCSGGNPKVVEIYASGTVDFSLYSLEKQSNGGSWGSTTSLADLGTVTDSFVYVYSDSNDPEIFASEYPSASVVMENSVVNINGDDGIRIVDAASNVIDQYGVDAVDGSGEFWEYADGFAKRVNGMGPNASFTQAEWVFSNGGLDGLGLCQGGTDTFETLTGAGTYVPSTSTEPSITITNPTNSQVLPLGTTDYEATFVTSNFTIDQTSGTGDGHIHVTLNSAPYGDYMFYTSDPIMLTGLTPGDYTLKIQLVDNGHIPLSPDVFAEVTFTVPSATEIADLATLRAQNADGSTLYQLTSEAYINYAQSYRNQKFIEDATAGILIDDTAAHITSGARGDGLSGIVGTLSEFNGMLQFVPQQDATLVSPSTLTLTPQSVTLADLTANFEDYEAELVTIEPVMIDNTANANFANGTDYVMTESTNNTDTFNFYTNFYDVDYIGTAINTAGYVSITGLLFERNTGIKFAARDLADFELLGVEDLDQSDDLVVLSSTLVKNDFTVFVEGVASVEVYNSQGQLVHQTTGQDEILIETNALTKGAYFVKITQNGQSVSKKVLKN